MDTVATHPPAPSVWDIVRVDFPFADRAETRRRPALVIAVVPVHADFALLWLAMITSASAGLWPLDVPISDLVSGGLLRPCVIRTSKIASLDSRLFVRTGTLAPADREAIATTLKGVLRPILTP